jgi:peptide/nickel transport system substrate-binding protein
MRGTDQFGTDNEWFSEKREPCRFAAASNPSLASILHLEDRDGGACKSVLVLEHDRMTIRRREFLRTLSAGMASLAMPHSAKAQPTSGALLLISESGANSVDPHTPGANRGCYEVAWNCYDRLLSLQIEKDENGVDHANATKPGPELAEEWNESGHSVTFKLRRNATFHDGAPVTAKDVKWSLDRAIAAGGNPKF